MQPEPVRQVDTTSVAEDISRRRKHLRVTDAEGLVFIGTPDGQGETEGELLDESCGGVGLAIDANSPIAAGAKVTVDFFGTLVRGVVRYREPLEDGRSRIGVEWQTEG